MSSLTTTVSLGVFIAGVTICIFAFNYFRNLSITHKTKEREDDLKVSSIKKILIKKELVLLFKDSNNIFSFAGLLIVQPFLMYLVVSALILSDEIVIPLPSRTPEYSTLNVLTVIS